MKRSRLALPLAIIAIAAAGAVLAVTQPWVPTYPSPFNPNCPSPEERREIQARAYERGLRVEADFFCPDEATYEWEWSIPAGALLALGLGVLTYTWWRPRQVGDEGLRQEWSE